VQRVDLIIDPFQPFKANRQKIGGVFQHLMIERSQQGLPVSQIIE